MHHGEQDLTSNEVRGSQSLHWVSLYAYKSRLCIKYQGAWGRGYLTLKDSQKQEHQLTWMQGVCLFTVVRTFKFDGVYQDL